MRGPALGLALLLIAYGVAAGLASRRFPAVNTDEVVIAAHGAGIWSGAGNRYPLYDGVFAPEVESLRDIFPDVTRGPYNAWVGFFHRAVGGFWGARLSSLAAGGLFLLLLYLLVRRWAGPGLGLTAAAVAAAMPAFLAASCVTRNETSLAAAVAGLLLAAARPLSDRAAFGLGLGAAASLGLHPNAFCALPGVLWVAAGAPFNRRRGAVLALAGGGLAGALLLLSLLDPARTALNLKFQMYHQLVAPPLLAWPWRPDVWAAGLLKSLFAGASFYFPDGGFAWSWARGAAGVMLSAGLAWSAWTRRAAGPWEKTLWAGLGATALLMMSLVRRQELFYSTLLLPFAAPLAAAGWARLPGRAARGLAAALLFTSVAGSGAYIFSAARRQRPYADVAAEVREKSGDPGLKMLGPNLLWFDRGTDRFRDAGAFLYSRWYTGGGTDVVSWMRPWKPDVLVVDETLGRIFFRGAPAEALAAVFPGRVEPLGAVDGGAGYGRWEIFRLHWRDGHGAS